MSTATKPQLNIELNRQLAREAGIANDRDKTDWFEAYTYHLGAVVEPLPFEQFKLRLTRLNRLLEQDPDGKVDAYTKQISDLSRQLGY